MTPDRQFWDKMSDYLRDELDGLLYQLKLLGDLEDQLQVPMSGEIEGLMERLGVLTWRAKPPAPEADPSRGSDAS